MKFYRNGVLLWEHAFTTQIGDVNNGRAWTIGQDWDGNNRTDFFDGNIDDVRIYDEALSEAEIATLTAGFATSCAVPSGYATVAAALGDTTCDIIDVAAGEFFVNDNISRNVLIRGAGEVSTFLTVEAGINRRGFANLPNNSATFHDLTIRDGKTIGTTDGAGIDNYPDAFLYLENVTFHNNTSEDRGGAILNNGYLFADTVTFDSNSASEGGAIATLDGDHATIVNSTFRENSADTLGGALYFINGATAQIDDSFFTENSAEQEGGAINAEGAGTIAITNSDFYLNTSTRLAGGIHNNAGSVMTIDNSTIRNNTGASGGGLFNRNATVTVTDTYFIGNRNAHVSAFNLTDKPGGGAIRTEGGTTVVERSLVRNNTSNFNTGSIMHVDGGSTTVRNSTLTGNFGGSGGGILSFDGTVIVESSTIYQNQANAGFGAGIYTYSSGSITISNSIVSNTDDGGDCTIGSGTSIISNGHNIISDGTCNFDATNGDQPNTSPLLGSLLPNGGATFTYMPQPDSPAIDAGGYDCVDTDQRGVERPNGLQINGVPAPTSRCDIGAVELDDGEPVSDAIAQQRLVDYQNYASLNDPLLDSCDALPARMAGVPMAGYQLPNTPIAHHEAGYSAAAPTGEQATIRTTDSTGRAVTVEGTLYDDPLRGNYGLVNLDQAAVGFVDDNRMMLDTSRASEVVAGQYAMSSSIEQIAGSEVEVGTVTVNRLFDLATGDLNGDNRAEEILAWRPSTVASAPIHIKVGGLPGETALLASEPVAQFFNGKLYLFAQGYDDALWVGVDTGEVWQWQRCGGTLASAPAVLATSPPSTGSGQADTLEIIALGTDNTLNTRTLSTSGATPWTQLPDHPTIVFEGTPALAESSDGTRHLLARGNDNTVWYNADSGSGYDSNSWQNLGGYLASDVAAIGYGSGKVALLVHGFDDALWYRLFDGGWGDWMTVANGGDIGLASTPTVVATGANSFDAFVRGSDDSLRKVSFNGSSFGAWQTIGVANEVAARPAVTNDGTQQIVYAARPNNNVLQRSDAGAAWSLVRAVAPGSTTFNTGLIPLGSTSDVVIETGHFLQDGREQIVLGSVNASSKLELRLYAVDGGFAPRQIATLTLPTTMNGSQKFDLTVGDFDGDGSAEIATFSVIRTGGLAGNIDVIDFDGSSLSVVQTKQRTFATSDQIYDLSIAAGNFLGNGKADLATGYTILQNGTPVTVFVQAVEIDDNTFAMTDGTRIQYGMDNASTYRQIDVATGDVNGAVAGVKTDEIVVALPHGTNHRQGIVKVFEVASSFNLTARTSSNFDSNNRPYALAVGDLDRDLNDDIALMRWRNDVSTQKEMVTWDIDGSSTNWVANIEGRRLYTGISGSQYHLALAVGDVTGQSLRVGAPSYRVQQNVGSIVAILNAPPTHVDTLGGNLVEVATGAGGSAESVYESTVTTVNEMSIESTRSSSLDLAGEVTVGNPEGTHVSTSLESSYGSDFSNGRESLSEKTITTRIVAPGEDRVVYTGSSYQVWEYPLYADNSGEPATHLSVVFPIPNSNVLNIDPGRGCDQWYQPSHQVKNIFSYPDLFDTSQFTGYSAANELFDIPKITVVDGETKWSVEMSQVDSSFYESNTSFGFSAGLETQIGGDTVSVGIDLPFGSIGTDITTPSIKASMKGSYSSSNMSTSKVTTSEEILIEAIFQDGSATSAFQVQSYLYRADGGYLVLDHTAIPNDNLFWQQYASADPTFRRPWAVDQLCGADKVDYSPEIVITPSYAEPGELVNIEATVHNYSNVQANSVTVRFYAGDPDNGGTPIGSDQTISNLNRADGAQTVSVDWLAEGSGDLRIYAVIDPDNALAEVHDEVTNVNNNKAYNLLRLAVTDFIDIGLPQTYYPLDFGTTATNGRAATDELTYSAHVALEGLSETLQFELKAIGSAESPAALAGYDYVGAPFDLTAYETGGTIAVDLTPDSDTAPSVIKVVYPLSVNDGDVIVRRWSGTSWVDAACGSRSVEQLAGANMFVVPTCETGRYAVFVDNNSVPLAVNVSAAQSASGPAPLLASLAMLVLGMTVAVIVLRRRTN